MNHNDERDHAEESYNAALCPACGCSPCDCPEDYFDALAADMAREDAERERSGLFGRPLPRR